MGRHDDSFAVRVGLTVAVFAAVAVCLRPVLLATESERALRLAIDAISDGEHTAGLEHCKATLAIDAGNPAALLLAGQAAARLHDADAAMDYLTRIDPPVELAAEFQFEIAMRALRSGLASKAEHRFREVLELDPQHVEANTELGYLLNKQGRCWESVPYFDRLRQMGHFQAASPLVTTSIETLFGVDNQLVAECLAAVPDDPIAILGPARHDLISNFVERSEEALLRVVDVYPELAEAQARVGRVIIERRPDDFYTWHDALSESVDVHPEIWSIRGLWAIRLQQPQVAIRCFLETLERYPFHREAYVHLSQLLGQQGRNTLGMECGEVSRDLSRIVYVGAELSESTEDPKVIEVREIMFRLGRYHESLAWTYALRRGSDFNDDDVKHISKCIAGLNDPPKLLPHQRIDRLDFPLPDWTRSRTKGSVSPVVSTRTVPVRFEEVTDSAGLNFRYMNGTTKVLGLQHMLQSTGGGIGVLDYDNDLWPDVYFGQSGVWPIEDLDKGVWPTSPEQNEYIDQLFRNLGDGRAEDCTAKARLADWRFTQGVSVGDWNNDGFMDVVVANVGCNRLYENNGDGTFTDVTDEVGIGDDRWSLSLAFGDLNQDGLPDLYVVNYLILEEVLARQCKSDNRPMGCAPTIFTAEQDQIYLNAGDGTFRNVTEDCGVIAPEGKGLGLVIADFADTGRLNVFVGNDSTGNLYYENESEAGGDIRMRESAVLAGLAYDEGGDAQSCMGIGCDDVNGDGRLDLFATNFYADSNTLYLQTDFETFQDRTIDANLRDASYYLLGFGCQFLDADLDSWPDLVISNGHVDRSIVTDQTDLMVPQFYQNSRQGRFRESSADDLGPYFQQKCLGRVVALLDWNRDGREDFCVSHLDIPASLLINRTETPGHSISLRLRGTKSARIPVGTKVTVRCGDRVRYRQLVSGNGYMCSNEDVLVFGLGDADVVDEITVKWPTGATLRFTAVPVGYNGLLREGDDTLHSLDRNAGIKASTASRSTDSRP